MLPRVPAGRATVRTAADPARGGRDGDRRHRVLRPPDETGTAGLGYGVAPETEGRGYATKALRALVHHGFADARVRRVLAETAHDNVASQRVLEKAGLRRISSDENLHYHAIEGWPLCPR
ncbi:GNAT family N-acetyltransferase [Streptomyces sp. NPDC049099]|uniref:GNAT family N-acetyltransferase n=1 Tax=Streptomyces sp. NPDC049099 TaxID=3155768 RepID=UPI003415E043